MKIIRILEITWLCIAIVGVVIGIIKMNNEGMDGAIYFLFPLVAAIFYYIRRKQRIRMQEEQEAGK